MICDGGLVHLHHRGVLIATHARRHEPDQQTVGLRDKTTPAPRATAAAASVTRKVDSSGRCRSRADLPGR